MKKTHYIFLILFVIKFSYGADSNTPLKHSGFNLTSIEKQLRYSNPGYELQEVHHNGISYTKPTIANAGANVEPGQPFLPTVSTFYAVEPGKKFSLNTVVRQTQTFENINILPFDSWENEFTGTVGEGASYQKNELFPPNIATVSDPIVFRDITMVQVSITPFQYNPISKTLISFQEIDVELVESGNTQEMPFIPEKRSKEFEILFESLIVNYNSLNRENIEYQRPSILYVLPNNIGNLFGTVEQLMDWKKRVGYDVHFVSSSNIVNNRNNLKNYIDDAYENWENPPVHVNIVGDANGSYDIPTWTESYSGYNGEGDYPYTTLEGNDVFPEVFIGRMSFNTSSHLNTIISKTLNYESNPYMNENWFQRACLVGDPNTSGVSCVITNEHINEILDLSGFEDVNTVYGGSFPTQMVSGINEGVGFFNYRGYYGVSGFGDNDVNSTSNGFMLPVATVITCGTGSFGDDSLIESFIRAGTPSNPKGSVVCIGTATLGTHTMFNNIVDMGFYYGTFIEGLETPGAALVYGKMMLYNTYAENPSNWCHIFTHWNNLMGESSLQMWTDYPEMTNVSHSYALTRGTNFIDVNVDKDTGPVENAWVTILMDGEIFESKYTDSQGFARLPITSSQTGEVLVTVTKKNHYPYQSSFQIYDPGVAVNLAPIAYEIDDDNLDNSNGNGNMAANSGETLEIFINANNYGSQNTEEVIAVISSNSPYVTIDQMWSQINLGSIEAGETISGLTPFVVSLDDGIPDGVELDLHIDFTDGNGNVFSGYLDIKVSGNDLTAYDVDVIGSANDILIPGQTSYVKIGLQNLGLTNANLVTGTITCASPFVEIIDNSGTWSSVSSGGQSFNGNDYYEISTLEETLPGTIAHLIINLETVDGYASNSIVPIQIGTPTVYDPVGPDDYGYYIYDNEDINYVLAPTYNWVEIDAREGGPGTHLNSLTDGGNNQDDVETINLPFTFTFYGQDYDQISICSNGWIAMGQTSLESFRNYQIPGVGGPSPMIAVFWDDLKLTNGGRVYTWYDQTEKKFYVEWSEVRTYQNNSTETFQAVLYDPSYYITPTGDGEILLQFKDFNNTSYGSYSWDQIHGNYCSVGIEDHTMTRGLQYTFNDTYHPAAMELGDETAILITTRGSDIRLEGDLNHDEIVDIYDLMLLVDYNLGIEGQVNPFFGDINGDGMVNVMDLISLIRQIMGYVQ